jgi:hypothetical protein
MNLARSCRAGPDGFELGPDLPLALHQVVISLETEKKPSDIPK